MKKTLALVLALAMVFSTITVAFAEDTLGEDAQTCKDLGMLKGESGTVDAAYAATAPSRLQAVIMLLRLRGLEAEALAFTGEENFADGNLAWAEGANLLAYLKANPQLGWQGDGTNFNPNSPITAKEYYKALLEALGYKQSTDEIAGGDFSWDNVLEFAAEKGLTKVAAVANFTVNDLAIATVEALNAQMKEGGKTLAATLVEAGKIDKAAAIAAGLYTDALTTTEAKVELVKALGNTVVLVGFDADVEKAFAENTANFAIVEKGTTTALEVKAAVLDGTSQVVLETAAMTAGKNYTLTIGEESKNFTGISKVSGVPAIDDVEGTDYNTVVVTFDKTMDLATVLDKANYTINNDVTVEGVAWDDDEIRESVELTTKGMNNSGSYKLTVTNVKSVDGATLKSASDTFSASADKKAPDLDSVDDERKTNTRVLLIFDEENDLTVESAENVANYTITDSSDAELEVISAKLRDKENLIGDSTKEAIVELTTASQKKGTKYEIAVINLVDDSVLANKITKAEKVKFSGTALDDDAPEVKDAEFLAEDLVKVEFEEDSRLDPTSVLDANNYSIDNDVVVEKVEMLDSDDLDENIIKLTISGFDKDEDDYELTVANIEDEYGNVMDEEEDEDLDWDEDYKVAATIDKVKVINNEEVEITFSRELNEDSAEDLTNYSIDGDIGTPKDAEYDSEDKTVTLTTREMDENETYELTVNGLVDIADNVLTNLTTDIVVSATANDTDAPEVKEVEAVTDTVIQVSFDEAIDVSTDVKPVIYINSDTDAAYEEIAVYASSEDEDDTVLNFILIDADDDSDGIWDTDTEELDPYTTEDDVVLLSTTARDLAGNLCDSVDEKFETSDEENEDVELDYADQVSVRKFELGFDSEIRFRTNVVALTGGTLNADGDELTLAKDSADGLPYKVTLTIDEDDDDNNTILYIEADKPMEEDSEFLGFTKTTAGEDYELAAKILVGKLGGDVENPSLKDMTADDEDEEEPYVDEVVAETRTSVVITFSEDMDPSSSENDNNYKVVNNELDEDDNDYELSVTDASVDGDEVTLTLGDALEDGVSYTLTVDEDVEDLAGNSIEETDFDFDGTDTVDVNNHITGVMVYNGTKFVAYTYDEMAAVTASVVYGSDDEPVVFDKKANDDSDEFTFTADVDEDVDFGTVADPELIDIPVNVLLADVTYTATLYDVDGDELDSYSFEGIIEDGDIEFDTADATDFIITYDDMEAGQYVAIVQGGAVTDNYKVAENDEEVTFDKKAAIVDTTEPFYVLVLNASGNVISAVRVEL